MSITGKQLAEFAVKCFLDGVRYWYGTCYYKCTTALLNSKTRQYPAHYTSGRRSGYLSDIADGAMCCDCIGLIKGAVWSELGAHAARYGTGGCPDKGANGMLEYCKAKGMAHGSMNTLPEIPGLLLHKQGHAGVYIGGGYAIEAKGFNADVVKSKVAGRGWTSWAKLPFIDYADGEGAVEVPTAPETTYTLGQRLLKRGCKGNDVAELQKALTALGFDVGKYGADGDFGYATEAAVKAMQKAAEISIDGKFGPESLKALRTMQTAGKAPEDGEGGGSSDDGGKDEPTYTVTIKGVDAATATFLLENYDNATAEQEQG